TKKWITLDFGPYTIHPGADLSRVDVEVPGADGYAIGFKPMVVLPDGTEASPHEIHIHHAHWLWLDPDAPGYHRWFYGTGEERTQGSIMPSAKADPRFRDGMRYGVKVQAGDRIGFLSMLHNKTASAMVVTIRVRIEYVYGTHDAILDATGQDFHELTPVLIGSTFHVPRTGGRFVFPLNTTEETVGEHSNYGSPVAATEVVPGVGQVWTSPWDGTVVIGAGHSHPGAREVVLSNMGSEEDPCPDDGDIFPGITAARSQNFTRNGVFPSEDFQMGLTQPGWRVPVRKGDRLVLNGVYDATNYAYPDAMSYFGFYMDQSDVPTDSERCTVQLVDRPKAPRSEVVRTVPNQKWSDMHAMHTCTKCDEPGELPPPGPETNVVHMAGFVYTPGDLSLSGTPLGPPVVKSGDTLHFVNEDFALGGVRHTITSCKAPCNGEYVANYPMADGVIESGALGYGVEDAYVSARPEPYWALDTSDLEAGFYSYYCRLHPWMRGGFYIQK
ncbi:MAG TPA: hypothetical protein VNC78_09235, partial [Actinomycetota bacterium]|nr:hypothetical protein [Actinomycetota bacterium]